MSEPSGLLDQALPAHVHARLTLTLTRTLTLTLTLTRYNGGLGEEQLTWLRAELAAAAAASERVVIMCHVILHPEVTYVYVRAGCIHMGMEVCMHMHMHMCACRGVPAY